VLPTIASPLQYGYRTKITPHFEAPTKKARKEAESGSASSTDKPSWFKIGFNEIGKRTVLDIEVTTTNLECFDLYLATSGVSYCDPCVKRSTWTYTGRYNQVGELYYKLDYI
jgi:hypothetical protein